MKTASSLLVALVAAASAPAQGTPIVLAGPALRAEFAVEDNAPAPGQRLDLRSLENLLEPLAEVGMAPGSGGWTVRLQRIPIAPGPPPPFIEVSMDGSVAASNPAVPVGTLDSLVLDDLQVSPDGGSLAAQWTLQATLDGVPGSVTVTTGWSLVPGEPFLDTTAGFVRSGGAGWHVALLTHPQIRVTEFEAACGTDVLLLPFAEGAILEDPTEGQPAPNGNLIPAAVNRVDNQPIQLAAYWDGCEPSRCVLVQPTEVGRSWKELHAQALPGAPGEVRLEYAHLPPDVYATAGWTLPAPLRVGLIEGDWWDAAARYREFLASDPETSAWYHGPVGSPQNPMPPHVKDLVAEVFLFNQYTGDNMDLLSRLMLDVYRMLGDDVLATFYGGHAPDRFGHWFLAGGYLPGRPSFAAAVREGQKQFHGLVMPYVQGSTVADCADPALGASQCAGKPVVTMAQTEVVLDEGLRPETVPNPIPPRGLFMSPRSAWWLDFFPAFVGDIATFTDAAALYLDFFLTAADFDPVYDPLTEPPPGGGDYPFTRRLQQLHAIREAQGDDFLLTLEFLNGRFTEEAHLMHADPTAFLLSVGTGPGPAGPVPVSMPNARIVPLFRAVHDNVKLARIISQNPYQNAAQRAWVEAVSVFTFGRVPCISWSFAEIDSPLSQRFPFAAYIGMLGGPSSSASPSGDGWPFDGLPGVGPCDEGPPPGGGPFEGIDVLESLCNWKPKKNFPFHLEVTGLTGALRDAGLLAWHNGTIERLPDYEVVAPPGFEGLATSDPSPGDGAVNITPVYLESLPDEARFLVPGMFRAPADDANPLVADSLAFVLCNPWIDPTDPATMQASFTFEPDEYAGWSDTTPYVVVMFQSGIPVFVVPFHQGDFVQPQVPMAPGEIRWWVFHKLEF